MIDMHSHFLFDVDDGPKVIEDTLAILEKVTKEGITDIIATPHAFSPHHHVSRAEIESQIRMLKDILQAAKSPIAIHAGQEVRLNGDLIEQVKAGEAMTLAGSKYLLLELPTQSVPAYTVPIIEQLLAQNIVPIIAHPERNRAIAEKPERLERLVRHGAMAQITASSLSGHFGKNVQNLSMRLIEANLIHTYGSDIHNLENRPLLFNEGLDYLEKRKYNNIVDILLENNARILTNENLIQLEPVRVKEKKWWSVVK